MGTLVVVLIVLQLLSFYFIVILNVKLSKFKELEYRQEQLMREMDNVVSAYLLEMREENDRLIEELSKTPLPQVEVTHNASKVAQSKSNVVSVTTKDVLPSVNIKEANFELEAKALVPKAVATKAYAQQKIPANEAKPLVEQNALTETNKPVESNSQALSYEEEVVQLANEGKSPEEIAKLMQKGKTEIELLLKFHS